MYCIHCGVQLSDHETKCPICGTRVVNPAYLRPDAPTPYPRQGGMHQEMNHHGILFVLTFIFLIPAILTIICDLSINHAIIWSGYTAGALALGYLIIVLPLWFRSPDPVIFVAADFAGILLYLFYINFAVGENWFMPFAFPVTAMLAIIICMVVMLFRYFKTGKLFILGGASLLLGGMLVATEVLMNQTFQTNTTLVWSIYPLAVFTLIGLMLIIIGLCPPLRESLKRKFFI